MQTLNRKQKLFVEAYCGDVVEAAQVAGYTGLPESLKAQGNKLLSDPHVMEAIKERSKYLNRSANAVANREQRMEFWTNIMNNEDPHRKEEKDPNGIPIPTPNLPLNVRLKASELLGKSDGDFIERINLTAKLSISDVIMESYQVEDADLDVIEAEYLRVRERRKLEAAEEEEQEEEEEELEEAHTTPTSLGDLI